MKIYAYRVEWNDAVNATVDLTDICQFLASKALE